ncbi:hypothetical protein P4S72_27930 [Vibrio sp. PP-XX7]
MTAVFVYDWFDGTEEGDAFKLALAGTGNFCRIVVAFTIAVVLPRNDIAGGEWSRRSAALVVLRLIPCG